MNFCERQTYAGFIKIWFFNNSYEIIMTFLNIQKSYFLRYGKIRQKPKR